MIEDELCADQTGDQSEGVVKVIFDCFADKLQYSCYADLDVEGVESEEVELDEDTAVVIDV